MEIRKAERKKAKLRLGISAPSGAGKTYILTSYSVYPTYVVPHENGMIEL
jgi:hypothetical protein